MTRKRTDLLSTSRSFEFLLHLPRLGDAKAASKALRSMGFGVEAKATLAEALGAVSELTAGLILQQESFGADGDAALEACLQSQPAWSDLGVVVFADEGFMRTTRLQRLLERWNLSILERPVRRRVLFSVLRALLRGRTRQLQAKGIMGELRIEKDRAERAVRNKAKFLAQISHDLRTPLTSIVGAAQLLGDEVEGTSAELLGLITENSRELQEMIQTILDLAYLDDLETRTRLGEVDLARPLESVVSALQFQARLKELELTVRAEEGLCARGHEEWIRRILHNLVSNAIKFTDEGGVTVMASRNERHLTIRVADTGRGISEAFREKLFEPFKREAPRAQDVPGTGLGLSIAKELVEKMDGSIAVESGPRGSIFTVLLPTGDGSAQTPGAVASSRPETAPRAGDRPRLLVVDDQPNTLKIIRKMLAPLAEVRCVESFEEAERCLRETSFDLLLLDIDLGDERSGLDLRQLARTSPANERTPAVAFTASVLIDDGQRYLEAGFDDVLGKPFSLDELRAILRRFGIGDERAHR